MTTHADFIADIYPAKGTIGNVGMPGAPIVHFDLIVVPSQHKVTGYVHITQAVLHGNYSGEVTGSIYATGIPPFTKIVGFSGMVHCDDDNSLVLLPFQASMAINNAWEGKGGFSYGNVHVEDVPVKPIKK
ncbi:MAG TPA: DUF1842 domain-containing protein [Prolixibacteraceae bacterium]|nr:DUF1842 domain-containing protein [Prolixibacteraceae bacterium]